MTKLQIIESTTAADADEPGNVVHGKSLPLLLGSLLFPHFLVKVEEELGLDVLLELVEPLVEVRLRLRPEERRRERVLFLLLVGILDQLIPVIQAILQMEDLNARR